MPEPGLTGIAGPGRSTLEPALLYPISRRHLDELRGDLGILQHAVGSKPDPAHGYCVDDAARALEVDLLHVRQLGWPAVADSAELSLRFLEEAFDASTGRFRNFRDIDGTWIGGPGSNDCVGRAMLALGETIASARDEAMRDRAIGLFGQALPGALKVKSPRAIASIVLGLAAARRSAPAIAAGLPALAAMRLDSTALMGRLATDLHARFLGPSGPGWPWLEDSLTYENALIPRALIVAGASLKADVMLRIGLQVLDWLIRVQTSKAGHLSPIGNGWWPRRGERSQFDQQPIEATALLLAAEAALAETGEPRYLAAMELAYGWFLGRNDLGRPMAVPSRGAGFDGLTASGVNRNQGAESTLMWLMAAEHIRAARNEHAARIDVLRAAPPITRSSVRMRTGRVLPRSIEPLGTILS
jgi:hypothetical protein